MCLEAIRMDAIFAQDMHANDSILGTTLNRENWPQTTAPVQYLEQRESRGLLLLSILVQGLDRGGLLLLGAWWTVVLAVRDSEQDNLKSHPSSFRVGRRLGGALTSWLSS
jgi:hypothetical protein